MANVLSPYLVRDVMSYGVEWVNETDDCSLAARIMLQRNIGALPVKDANGFLRGIVTDRDLVIRLISRRVKAPTVSVASIMTPNVSMIYDDENLMVAERQMIERGLRRLVVLRRFDNTVIGIVSVDDIAVWASMARAGEVVRAAANAAQPSGPTVKPDVTATNVRTTTQGPGGAGFVAQGQEEFASSTYLVSHVYSPDIEWINDTESCQEAAIRMRGRNIGCLPVCTAGAQGRLAGILTDRDLVVRVLALGLDPESTLVRDAMSKDVVCCFSDDNLADAQKLMIDRSVRRLPVLNRGDNKVIGVMSLDDIAMAASRARAGSILRAVASPEALAQGQKQALPGQQGQQAGVQGTATRATSFA